MATVVGVDAAKRAGWVAVTLEERRLASIVLHQDLDDLLADAEDAAVLAFDIPIGHEEDPDRGGWRAADLAARARLGPRAATVFPVPPLRVLEAADHGAAIAAAGEDLKPSAQLWALRDRILALDARASRDPRVHEVHPEVSFLVLAEELDRGLTELPPKRTWNGIHDRLVLLRDVGLRPTRSMGGVGRASPDDVLDATIAAWSAARIEAGEAKALPDPRPRDPRTGRAVAVWA